MTDDRHAQRRLGLVLSFLSAVSWSSAGFFTRFIPLDVWTLLFWRGIFGALFIGAYALWQARGGFRRMHRGLGWRGVAFALCSAVSTLALIPAFRLTTVANASVILATGPFIVALFAWTWLRERSSRSTLIAAGIAALGVAVMVAGSGGSGSRIGDGLALMAIAAMSLIVVGVRRHRGIPVLAMVALANVLVALASLPFATPGAAGPSEILLSALFAAATMIMGFVLLVLSSRLIPAVETSLISTLETPLAPLWIWLAFGEMPSHAAFLGGAVVLAAVIGHLLAENRRARPAG